MPPRSIVPKLSDDLALLHWNLCPLIRFLFEIRIDPWFEIIMEQSLLGFLEQSLLGFLAFNHLFLIL